MPPSWRWHASQLATATTSREKSLARDLRAGRRNEVVDGVGRVLHRHRRDARRGAGRRVAAGRGRAAREGDGHAVRQAGLIGHVAEVGDVVRRAHGHPVELRLDGRDVAVEGVRVAAVAVVDQRAGVVGARTARRRRGRGRARHRGDDVAHPLARCAGRARHELGDGEGQVRVARDHRGRALAGVAEPDDRPSEAVEHGEADDRRAGDRHAGDGDRRLQVGPGLRVGRDRVGVGQRVAADARRAASSGSAGRARSAGSAGRAGRTWRGRAGRRAGWTAIAPATGQRRGDHRCDGNREPVRNPSLAHCRPPAQVRHGNTNADHRWSPLRSRRSATVSPDEPVAYGTLVHGCSATIGQEYR